MQTGNFSGCIPIWPKVPDSVGPYYQEASFFSYLNKIKPKMLKRIKEISIIIFAAVLMAFITNSISPAGIPLLGQWDASEGVVRADPDDEAGALGIEIDNVEIAKQIYDRGGALFVDARSEADYNAYHVKGAVSLPLGEFESKIETFLSRYMPDQTVISYCSGRFCEDSHHLAEMLIEFGYEHVSVMIDGISGWVEKGYPID
jgi:rhodanese-related sulfurtransferase